MGSRIGDYRSPVRRGKRGNGKSLWGWDIKRHEDLYLEAQQIFIKLVDV